MGGFFGLASKRDALQDVFFGTDYHSHLGNHRGGIACYDQEIGLQREIHDIEEVPFRARFEHIFDEMQGNSAIGCISDFEPQPLLIRSKFGAFAICYTGTIINSPELIQDYLALPGAHFDAMTSGGVNSCELIAAMINQKENFLEGLLYVQERVLGTASILILKDDGSLLVARDRLGRLPVQIGKNEDGYCASFEDFAFRKLGYEKVRELEPGEIVELTPTSLRQLAPPREAMRMCAFLWVYYGFPNASYEGVNVEDMRYRNGRIMAQAEMEQGTLPEDLDYVGGVPDSGIAHALGYAAKSQVPFARPMIKYTPTWMRSFTKDIQQKRSSTARMKQIPVVELIQDKSLLFVDDSIVRGTQLHETVAFLFRNGARAVHIRAACPPIMYACKYLNFSRMNEDRELITRRVIQQLEGPEGDQHLAEYADTSCPRGKRLRETLAQMNGFDSLEFQSLEGLIEAIGLPECKLCTYCWNGRE